MLTLEQVSSKFTKVRMNGSKNFTCLCPTHNDTDRSLVVSINEGKWVNAYCFGACDKQTVANHLLELGFNKTNTAPKYKKVKDEEGRIFTSPISANQHKEYFQRLATKYGWDMVFPYRNIITDKVYLYMVRINQPDGKKEFKPYTCWKSGDVYELHLKGIPSELKTPLFMMGPESKTYDTCYIYEGERMAVAGNKLFNGPGISMHVSWPFGCNGVKKADWNSLKGLGIKEYILIPDNDKAGRECMDFVAKAVSALSGKVFIINTTEFPDKWDVADLTSVRGFIKDNRGNVLGKEPDKTMERYEQLQQLINNKEEYKPAQPARQFAYIEEQERFYDLTYQRFYSEKGYNNVMAPITNALRHSNEFHTNPDSLRAQRLTFDPKIKDQVFEKDGVRYLNDYVPHNPNRVPGDVTPFLEHISYLVPDELNAQFLIKWMAFCVQNLGRKMKSAILLFSPAEGVGKTTLYKILRYCIGEAYCSQIQQHQITSQFNSWAVNKLLIGAEEIAIKGNYEDRSTSMDKWKYLITEDYLAINSKNDKEYELPNFINLMLFSNNPTPITLTPTSRRFFVWQVEATAKPKDYYIKLYEWFEKDGYAKVCNYLMEVNLAGFDADAPPPKTKYFYDLVEKTSNPVHQQLDTLFESNSFPFTDKTALVSPQHLEKALKDIGIKINTNSLLEWLRKNGACKVKQIDWGQSRPTIWAFGEKDTWMSVPPKEIASFYIEPVFEFPNKHLWVDHNQVKTLDTIKDLENLTRANQMNNG